MTPQQFEERKKEVGFIQNDFTPENTNKLFKILSELPNPKDYNVYYSASLDVHQIKPLDHSLPQYQNYGK